MTKYLGILRRLEVQYFCTKTAKMSSGNERIDMIKKVEEASKLNPEKLKKVDGNFRLLRNFSDL